MIAHKSYLDQLKFAKYPIHYYRVSLVEKSNLFT